MAASHAAEYRRRAYHPPRDRCRPSRLDLLSAIVLVAVNLIPLVGVAFWGWSLMLILVLYWIESGIVGVINIFKIARAQGEATAPFTRRAATASRSGCRA